MLPARLAARVARSCSRSSSQNPRVLTTSSHPTRPQPHRSSSLSRRGAPEAAAPEAAAAAGAAAAGAAAAGASIGNGSARASAVGLASGLLGSLCGVGGAVFVIPGLVRFVSLPQRVAAGNALIAVSCIAVTGATSFASAGHVSTQIAIPLGLSAAIATPFGALAASRVQPRLLRSALGLFLLLLSPVMPLRSVLERRAERIKSPTSVESATLHRDPNQPEEQHVPGMNVSRSKQAILAGAGLAVGAGSGLLGISGGSLFTPLIALVCPHASFKAVLGTSFAAMIVPTIIGATTYARMGFITPPLVLPLVAGSVAGAAVGASTALAVPEDALRWAFAAVFAVLGARILRAPIRSPSRAPSQHAN